MHHFYVGGGSRSCGYRRIRMYESTVKDSDINPVALKKIVSQAVGQLACCRQFFYSCVNLLIVVVNEYGSYNFKIDKPVGKLDISIEE